MYGAPHVLRDFCKEDVGDESMRTVSNPESAKRHDMKQSLNCKLSATQRNIGIEQQQQRENSRLMNPCLMGIVSTVSSRLKAETRRGNENWTLSSRSVLVLPFYDATERRLRWRSDFQWITIESCSCCSKKIAHKHIQPSRITTMDEAPCHTVEWQTQFHKDWEAAAGDLRHSLWMDWRS